MRLAGLVSLASLALACSPLARSLSEGKKAPRAVTIEASEGEPSFGPARYVLTQDMGALFDESSESSTMARAEPALVNGARLLVDAGVVRAKAKDGVRFSGFRSMPARLGGGYLLWSDDATYKADDFLGDLRLILNTSAPGGARPWLSSALLRTERGVVEVDPKSLAARLLPPSFRAAFADGLAVDERRAVRADTVGRTCVTLDGGQSFSDITEQRGFLAGALREEQGGALLLSSMGQPELRLVPGAGLEPFNTSAAPLGGDGPSSLYYTPPSLETTFSRTLGLPELAQAAAAGAGLSEGRALVARRSGLRLLSTRSARLIDDADLRGVSEWLSHCQPVAAFAGGAPSSAAAPEVLLACAHARGAHVLRIEGDMGAPKLVSTFSDRAGFAVGARGVLAFLGRSGGEPPSAAEFKRNNAQPPSESGAGGGEPSASPQGEMGEAQEPAAAPLPEEASPKAAPGDAFVSVYRGAGLWLEHHVGGRYAKDLYRWIPGEDGSAVALVFASKGSKEPGGEAAAPRAPGTSSKGARVVEVDPSDEALQGGALPPPLAPEKEPPYRSIDPDFWLDDDGSIRGWVRLPLADEASPKDRPLGGPIAGVRIEASGKISVFPLPPDTEHVVRGGRFALAMASKDDNDLYFETTDGGRTWTPIAAPPVLRMEPPDDPSVPFACSALGCALGGGLVRLGWGGPPPGEADKEAADDPPPPPINPPIASLPSSVLVCREAGDPPPAGSGKADGAEPLAPISIRTQAAGPLGRALKGVWSAEALPPFQPSARPRSIVVRDPAIGPPLHGPVVPILAGTGAGTGARTQAAVDLAFLPEKRLVRLGGAASSFLPFEYGGRIAAFADGPGGSLVGIDADRGFIVLAAPSSRAARTILRIPRVDDATRPRLTLARILRAPADRADPGGLAIIGYSTSSGDVVVAPLDLARAEVGPLRPLGSLASLLAASAPSCAPDRLLYRFIADIPIEVRLTAKGGRELLDTSMLATALLAASSDQLCVEGLELTGNRSAVLSVAFSSREPATATARLRGSSQSLVCSLEAPAFVGR